MKKKLLFLFAVLISAVGTWAQNEDMLSTPLTLEAIEAGRVSFKNQAEGPVAYRVNGGEAQTIMSKEWGEITVAAGDKVAFFGDNASYGNNGTSILACNTDCYIYGNIMSLVSSSNFATSYKLEGNDAFYALFSGNTYLKNHPSHQLMLPATTLTEKCYNYMFDGCTGLTKAPALPATTLAEGCYNGMFRGCTGLTKVSELPATTLAKGCYTYMFRGCTGLIEVPDLPATTLAEECYTEMFKDCTGLTKAPALPATTLDYGCYSSMFSGCTGLTEAPALPATTLAENCYGSMFYGCSGLTEAPALPATTLARNCYGYMFYGCTGLTKAPELFATTLVVWCYRYMFGGCKNLNNVTCLATNISARQATLGWLNGVAANGTFTKVRGVDWHTSQIPEGWTVKIYGEDTSEDEDMFSTPLTLEAIKSGKITFDNKALGPVTYRVNGGEMQTIKSGTTGSIDVNVDDKVAFYGNNQFYGSSEFGYLNSSRLLCTADCYVYGNVMSLISSTDFANAKTLTERYAFRYLFCSNTYLRSHHKKTLELPAKTLTEECYSHMFYGCSGLTVAPALPATILAMSCYWNMFYGCTGLTKAPELPATTLAGECYSGMFADCTGLTVAPELPATSLVDGCYRDMFARCKGLTVAPELPATTLVQSCYSGMFMGCTGLTEAPKLPATTLAKYCYGGMFQACTGLTKAPALPVTTLVESCYSGMFRYCTGLTEAPELPATTLARECYSGMFQGCTGLTEAPALPATTLAENCYSSMFYGCSGLTEAPALPAMTLVRGCYSGMFADCKNLSCVTCLATDISGINCTPNWLYNVAATGTFIKAKSVDWSTGISGIPEGWTVVDYDMTGINGTTATANRVLISTYDLRGMKTANKKGLKIVKGRKVMTK